MSKEGDFDDIIDDLGGLGKYQIRLLVLLLGKQFYYLILFYYVLPRSSILHHALPPPSPGVCAPQSSPYLHSS